MAVDFVVVTSGPFVGKVRVDMAIGGKNAGRVRSGKRLVQGGAVTIRGRVGGVKMKIMTTRLLKILKQNVKKMSNNMSKNM